MSIRLEQTLLKLIKLYETKKRVFQKVETLTLLTHARSEFTPGSNKHTFEPRAGDNLWLNISRLVWLHVLNC